MTYWYLIYLLFLLFRLLIYILINFCDFEYFIVLIVVFSFIIQVVIDLYIFWIVILSRLIFKNINYLFIWVTCFYWSSSFHFLFWIRWLQKVFICHFIVHTLKLYSLFIKFFGAKLLCLFDFSLARWKKNLSNYIWLWVIPLKSGNFRGNFESYFTLYHRCN